MLGNKLPHVLQSVRRKYCPTILRIVYYGAAFGFAVAQLYLIQTRGYSFAPELLLSSIGGALLLQLWWFGFKGMRKLRSCLILAVGLLASTWPITISSFYGFLCRGRDYLETVF